VPEGHDTRWRDPVGALFSTAATDNAEVVPPEAGRGPESMWSTTANEPVVEPEEAVDGEVVDDAGEPGGAHGPGQVNGHGRPPTNGQVPPPGGWNGGAPRGATPGPPPGPRSAPVDPIERFGGVFSAEPVRRPDDVIDAEGESFDLDAERSVLDGAALGWSDGSVRPTTTNGAPLFAKSRAQPEPPDPWSPADGVATGGAPPRSPFAAEVVPPRTNAAPATGPVANGASDPRYRRTPPPPPRVEVGLDGRLTTEDVADPNGLRAVISHLPPAEVQRASVPIAVCGALLQRNERVLGAVTGQMLGRPAVVVVTGSRVLVVNDRQWQPIVDEFRIDSSLVVRGRHDRNVAALSFADADRLALVDGITEVSLAIELAERIRQVGST